MAASCRNLTLLFSSDALDKTLIATSNTWFEHVHRPLQTVPNSPDPILPSCLYYNQYAACNTVGDVMCNSLNVGFWNGLYPLFLKLLVNFILPFSWRVVQVCLFSPYCSTTSLYLWSIQIVQVVILIIKCGYLSCIIFCMYLNYDAVYNVLIVQSSM